MNWREKAERKHGKPIKVVVKDLLNHHATKQAVACELGIQKETLLNFMNRHQIKTLEEWHEENV